MLGTIAHVELNYRKTRAFAGSLGHDRGARRIFEAHLASGGRRARFDDDCAGQLGQAFQTRHTVHGMRVDLLNFRARPRLVHQAEPRGDFDLRGQ